MTKCANWIMISLQVWLLFLKWTSKTADTLVSAIFQLWDQCYQSFSNFCLCQTHSKIIIILMSSVALFLVKWKSPDRNKRKYKSKNSLMFRIQRNPITSWVFSAAPAVKWKIHLWVSDSNSLLDIELYI